MLLSTTCDVSGPHLHTVVARIITTLTSIVSMANFDVLWNHQVNQVCSVEIEW